MIKERLMSKVQFGAVCCHRFNSNFISFSFSLSFEPLPLALEGVMVIRMRGKTIQIECYFVNSEKKIKGLPTIAPSLASSSPNSSARFDTACVTLSTLICSLYVNQ